jgi:hypothetical protein
MNEGETMSDIISRALGRLEKKKRLFHSESHLSAWLTVTLKQMLGLSSMPKLQKAGFYSENKRLLLDMLFDHRGREYAVELKYARGPMGRGGPLPYKGDVYYAPKSGAADDITRFNFLKDVMRLESEIPRRDNSVGFALLLTNRRTLWEKGDETRNDTAFFLHDGIPQGTLKWKWTPSPETRRRAGDGPLKINGNYSSAKWRTYTKIPELENEMFRYLLVKVY